MYAELFGDNFNRVVANSWGQTPDGRNWLQRLGSGGSASDFNVNGSQGTQTVQTAGSFWLTHLEVIPDNIFTNCEVRVLFDASVSDVLGGGIFCGPLIRVQDENNYYFCRVNISPSENVSLQIFETPGGQLADSGNIPEIVFTGQPLMVAFRAEGSTLSGKVWDPASMAEPEFQAIGTDDTFTSGSIGIRSGTSSGNTNILLTPLYDNLSLLIPVNFNSSPLMKQRYVAFDRDPKLDLIGSVGKRTESFIFQWIDGLTGQIFGYLHPRVDSVTLSHNTESSIKRQLEVWLDFRETSLINIIRDRILPFIVINGVTYPLGRYMFTDNTEDVKSEGNFGSYTLMDESFALDTELDAGWSPQGRSIPIAARLLVEAIPFIRTRISPSPFDAIGSFPIGTSRLSVLETYEELGDYFPFWMDHEGVLRMIRTKDPAVEIPDFSYDDNPSIVPGIAKTTDLFTRPNRFVVIGDTNNSNSQPIVGISDIPSSAPHSIQNRGFIVPRIERKSVSSVGQATAIARNLALRDTIIENLEFDTPLDPRHDSYNILHLLGQNWIEYAWSMNLRAGGRMSHSVRRFYR